MLRVGRLDLDSWHLRHRPPLLRSAPPCRALANLTSAPLSRIFQKYTLFWNLSIKINNKMTTISSSTMAGTMRIFVLLLSLISISLGDKIDVSDEDTINHVNFPLLTDIPLSQSVESVTTIMNSVDKLPSCAKVASAALLNSCAQLDHSSSVNIDISLDLMLDKTKSIYATRLAVCELQEAGASIPNACSSFQPTTRNTRKPTLRGWFSSRSPTPPIAHYEVYDKETAEQLDKCKVSLHSKPQSWTSFSNARQNAVLMCHTMRAAVERDDALEYHRFMMDVNAEATAKMSAATQDFESFLKDFRRLRQGMQSFQVELSKDQERLSKEVAAHWVRILEEVHDFKEDISRARQTTKDMSMDLDSYSVRSNLVQGASIDAFVNTHESLLRAQATIRDIAKDSQTNLHIQGEIQQGANIAYLTIASTAAMITDVQRGLNDMHSRMNETRQLVEDIHSFSWTTFPLSVASFHQTILDDPVGPIVAMCLFAWMQIGSGSPIKDLMGCAAIAYVVTLAFAVTKIPSVGLLTYITIFAVFSIISYIAFRRKPLRFCCPGSSRALQILPIHNVDGKLGSLEEDAIQNLETYAEKVRAAGKPVRLAINDPKYFTEGRGSTSKGTTT